MRMKKSHETGSLMVEVIAVLALLGVMGTMMFRQVQRRNEELDNINMASEIRMVKEATAAYIQANRAALEADTNRCPPVGDTGLDETTLPLSAVEKFLPDNWISDTNTDNGIIHEYQIYLSCYRINSTSADNRLAMYGTVVPNAPDSIRTPLPPNFSLRRAARVATLIGADGGIHESDGGDFVGTMGAWQVECDYADESDPSHHGPCTGRDDNFYVATTGMDIYVPEVDKTADSTVAVPQRIAFHKLHTTDYFSVGDGSTNCVSNYDTEHDQFAHENLGSDSSVRHATNDEIKNPGVDSCSPLFWVGASTDGNNGHVYVKNNLYVGRDGNGRQAVAIETDSNNNANRSITVFDTDGHGTITLNGLGEIVGRSDSNGKGYRLDAANGEIILFEEKDVTINGATHTVQIPTMRLKDGRLESNVEAEYYDEAQGQTVSGVYAVDPAGESLMNDIRLTSRGGAKLSDILPNYILKGTQTINRPTDGGASTAVTKPSCPHGYAAAITVTPIRYSQYVKSASLDLHLVTSNVSVGDGITGHTHNVIGNINQITQQINGAQKGNTLHVNGTSSSAANGSVNNTRLTLIQLPPVNISIVDDAPAWNVTLTYGDQPATQDDPITALAQTYCLFEDAINRGLSSTNDIDNPIPDNAGGLQIATKTAAIITNKACTIDTDCDNTEACVNGRCQKLGTCDSPDNTSLGNNIYCVDHIKVYLECFNTSDCGTDRTCSNNRCVTSP